MPVGWFGFGCWICSLWTVISLQSTCVDDSIEGFSRVSTVEYAGLFRVVDVCRRLDMEGSFVNG